MAKVPYGADPTGEKLCYKRFGELIMGGIILKEFVFRRLLSKIRIFIVNTKSRTATFFSKTYFK